MQEGSDLVEYMNAFNQVGNDLARLGATVDDEDRAILLLCSLSSSYDHLITTSTHGKETVKNEDILQYEKEERGEISHGEGLLVKGEEWQKGCEVGKNKNKKKKVRCHKCKQWGHEKGLSRSQWWGKC